MEKRYGVINCKNGGRSSHRRPYRSEEFREEDVWEVIKEDYEKGLSDESKGKMTTSLLSVQRRLPSAARMIPVAQKHQNKQEDEPKMIQQSAPVNVPDWSKIYRKNPRGKNATSSSTHDHDGGDDDEYDVVHDDDDDDDDDYGGYDDDDDDDDGGRLPPHEWLARKFARNQISSFSVCEGAGRTLKGRDLSRVRNAVLSKTGFI